MNDPGMQQVFPVTCGDTLFASISTVSHGQAHITLTDGAHREVKHTYTTTTTPAASTSTAECIAERPSYEPNVSAGQPPLADFSQASITNCSVTPLAGTAATPITNATALLGLAVVGGKKATPLVNLGPLDAFGDFSVTWKAAQ